MPHQVKLWTAQHLNALKKLPQRLDGNDLIACHVFFVN